MWSKEKVIELKLAPDSCFNKYNYCGHVDSCDHCWENNKEIFAERVVKDKEFGSLHRAYDKLNEVFGKERIEKETLKDLAIEYIKTDFKKLFNELHRDDSSEK